jgi:hypothetical protein
MYMIINIFQIYYQNSNQFAKHEQEETQPPRKMKTREKEMSSSFNTSNSHLLVQGPSTACMLTTYHNTLTNFISSTGNS